MVINGFSREQSSRLRELVLGYLSPGIFFFFSLLSFCVLSYALEELRADFLLGAIVL